MSGPGIHLKNFLLSLTNQQLLELIPTEIRDVVSALASGQGETDLGNIVYSVIDFPHELSIPETRIKLISWLSEDKQTELSNNLSINHSEPSNKGAEAYGVLDKQQLVELTEFFGISVSSENTTSDWPSETIKPDYPLFDYQLTAVNKLMSLIEGPQSNRGVLHFPTGGGKTRTAMHFVCRLLTRERCVVVWLASGKELLEQASEAFREAWTHLGNRSIDLHQMHGDMNPEIETFSDGLLIVGLQKAASKSRNEPDYWKKLSKNVRLVVFDEAHQTIATTYQQVVEDLAYAGSTTAVLGLTATPGRTWSDIDKDAQLADFYHQNLISLEIEGAEKDPIGYLISNGFLSQPDFQTLHIDSGMEITAADLEKISTSLEIPKEIIDELTLREQYLAQILKTVQKLIAEGRTRILVFAASVLTAQLVDGLLASWSIHSACITGKSSSKSREGSIKQFKGDKPEAMVLVNFGVLTTGFDAPNADAAIIARPTKSLVLYSQMVGRAIRGPQLNGTKTCTIVTVVDTSLPSFGSIAESFTNWSDVWR